MTLRTVGGIDLWVEQGGSDGPTLLLMHGLSGTGALWDGLREIVAHDWPGRWIIPDMRGHGRSGHSPFYGIALHAADMAALVGETDRLILAGHSMGGLVGMLLASGWFGVKPDAVVTVGVKVTWSEEEYAGIDKLASAPVRWFDTRAEAQERFVLVTGLKGIVDPDSDIAATGVVEQNARFRLAADNRTAMVARASTQDIHAAATAPIVLSCGEGDRMVGAAELRTLDPDAVELTGLGHNAHVEDPAAFWALVASAAGL